MTPCRVAALIDKIITLHTSWRNKDLHSRREVKRARSAECVSFRCVRINCPAQFSAALSAVLERAVRSGVLSCAGGLDHNFQRVLWFITEVRSLQDLRHKKIGESEGKKAVPRWFRFTLSLAEAREDVSDDLLLHAARDNEESKWAQPGGAGEPLHEPIVPADQAAPEHWHHWAR